MGQEHRSGDKRLDKRHVFRVEDLSCAACVRAVESELRRIPGVRFASVNLATGKAFVLTGSEVSAGALFEGVRKAGYTPKAANREDDNENRHFARARWHFYGSLLLGIPVAVLMAIHGLGLAHGSAIQLAEEALSTFLILGLGWQTLRSAFIALTHRHANMDVLISLATLAALSTVPLSRFIPGLASFGGLGAMILAFHLSGRYLEARLKWRAGRSLRELLGGQKSHCQLILEDGTTETFPVDELQPGMRVLLRYGEQVGADGLMEQGEVLLDEGMVSGEAIPVPRRAGEAVVGGTLVVQGTGVMRVTAAASDSFLAKMLGLVEEAQSLKIPLQAFADRVTHYFVPVVFFLAVAAGAIWAAVEGPNRGVSIALAALVVACPCALGLATPMALMAATAHASRRGILFKTGEALQRPRELRVVIFDKTGTLTLGRPRVVAHDLAPEWWAVIAALEERSLHPLARAVEEAAKAFSAEGATELEQIEEVPGKGMQAVYRGKTLFLGQPLDAARYGGWLGQGRTVIELRYANEVAGALALEDPLKPDAAETVAELKQRGLRLILATGDHELPAQHVAEKVGIAEVHARCRPEEKFQLVQRLTSGGSTVAVVGDGINDAAALKAADVGIAMGSAAALSAESADAVLVHNQLHRLVDLIDISGETYRQIRFNLFWAFFYNILALPFALLGLVHPLAAELAMLGSSITVVLGSWLLAARLNRQHQNRRSS